MAVLLSKDVEDMKESRTDAPKDVTDEVHSRKIGRLVAIVSSA